MLSTLYKEEKIDFSPTSKAVYEKMPSTIYVLKLTKGKYYIGRTNKKAIVRFKEHKVGKGSVWTRKYKPIGIERIDLGGDKFDEDKLTKQYMEKYGIENVRGGTYCKITLSNETIEMISKELNGGTNKCYNCGKTGHYIKNCPYEQVEEYVWCCDYCSKEFSSQRGCTMHENMHCKRKPKHCTRCNRDGHTISQCYATTKIVDESDDESNNYYQRSQKCYKCGKYGHYASNCYSRKYKY
tara:strand:+ start:272 stop:988 length:717 start_codon:yes stop_codon:yes gene_type:complete